MSYGKELRERAYAYRQAGHSQVETGKVFGVSPSAIGQWEKRVKEQKPLERDPVYHSFKKIDPVRLDAYMKEHPQAIQAEIAAHFGCSTMALSKALKRHGYSRKKGIHATWSKGPKK